MLRKHGRENIAAERRKREKRVRKEAGSEGVVLRKNEEIAAKRRKREKEVRQEWEGGIVVWLVQVSHCKDEHLGLVSILCILRRHFASVLVLNIFLITKEVFVVD